MSNKPIDGRIKRYEVHNREGELLFSGTAEDLIQKFEISRGTLYANMSKTKKGILTGRNKGFRWTVKSMEDVAKIY